MELRRSKCKWAQVRRDDPGPELVELAAMARVPEIKTMRGSGASVHMQADYKQQFAERDDRQGLQCLPCHGPTLEDQGQPSREAPHPAPRSVPLHLVWTSGTWHWTEGEMARRCDRFRSRWPDVSPAGSLAKRRIGRALHCDALHGPTPRGDKAAYRHRTMPSAPRGGDVERRPHRWISNIVGWPDAWWRQTLRYVREGASGPANRPGRGDRQPVKRCRDDAVESTVAIR